MNSNFQIPGSSLTILKVLFFGAILYFLFAIIKKVIEMQFMAPLRSKKVYRLGLNDFVLLAEVVSWLVFVSWSIQVFSKNNALYSFGLSILLLIILTGVSWSILRDFVSGIIIKLESTYSINEWLKVRDVEGKITKLGYRSLEIETEKGETVNIPYSIITKEMSIKSSRVLGTETIKSYTFELKVQPTSTPPTPPKSGESATAYDNQVEESSSTPESQSDERGGIKESKEKIRKLILNSHWSSLKREPQIKLLEETDAGYTFQITVYTLDAKYFQEIESYVKSQIS